MKLMKSNFGICSIILFFINILVFSEESSLTILDLSDKFIYMKGLESAGGFSCLIEGKEKTILFDAAQYGEKLLKNMYKLGVDPKKIDIIFLSHIHKDHTGGVASVLNENPNITLYIPEYFLKDKNFSELIKIYPVKIKVITKNEEICKDVYSTGVMGKKDQEQSLVIRTDKGLIVITGCAHPGIIEIIKKVRSDNNTDIFYLLGGFHLEDINEAVSKDIISSFRYNKIEYVSPTHCTGIKQSELFKEEYKNNFIDFRTGRKIVIRDLN